jgi:hypothetical protein
VANVERGQVVVFAPLPTKVDGDSGGGPNDEHAAAKTTSPDDPDPITDIDPHVPTTPFPAHAPPSSFPVLPIDASHIRVSGDSSLLHRISTISTSSIGGRARASGGPRRTRHFRGHSSPSPPVAEGEAAARSRGRPAAYATLVAWEAPLRPTPAGLLSSSPRPQPGRTVQQSVRAGAAFRVTGRQVHIVRGAEVGRRGVDGKGTEKDKEEIAHAPPGTGPRSSVSPRGEAMATCRTPTSADLRDFVRYTCNAGHIMPSTLSTRPRFPRRGSFAPVVVTPSAKSPARLFLRAAV